MNNKPDKVMPYYPTSAFFKRPCFTRANSDFFTSVAVETSSSFNTLHDGKAGIVIVLSICLHMSEISSSSSRNICKLRRQNTSSQWNLLSIRNFRRHPHKNPNFFKLRWKDAQWKYLSCNFLRGGGTLAIRELSQKSLSNIGISAADPIG